MMQLEWIMENIPVWMSVSLGLCVGQGPLWETDEKYGSFPRDVHILTEFCLWFQSFMECPEAPSYT